MVDRQGVALTENVPRFALVLAVSELPRYSAERERNLKEIAERAQIPYEDLLLRFNAARVGPQPITVKSGLNYEEALDLLFQIQHIRGLSLEIQPARSYPRGPAFAPVLGYLSKMDPAVVADFLAQGYGLDDWIGKTGLEAQFEKTLRGRD